MIAKETQNEIAKQYLKIEQNTQYLTHIQHFNVSITFRKPVRLLENIVNNPTIEVHSLCKIMVQFTYLLYTCCIYNTDIYIGPQLLEMRRTHDGKIQVKMQYLLSSEFQNIECTPQRKQALQKIFKKCCVSKGNFAYGQIVLSMLRDLLKKAKINIEKLLSLKNINQQQNEKHKRMYENLQIVVEKYLEREVKKITKPKVIIQCLEQTQIFRQYSSLLKIINCSLFYSMKLKSPMMEKLKQTKKQELIALQNKKIQPKNIQPIQKVLDQFFLYLINKKVVSVTKTVNQMGRETEREQQSNLKVGSVTATKNGRLFEVRVKVHERPMRMFDEKIYQQIYQKYQQPETSTTIIQQQEMFEPKKADTPKVSSSDFLIEVVTDKELIIVKYVTDIELNIENTDVVMYQCNNIPFDLVSVTLELIENSSAKPGGQNAPKKKDKIVVFKTMSHYNAKEQPLTKILLMIDLVMICAKILQPQLKRPNLKMQDYWRVEQLAKKSNHITNLFIRKVSKLYNQIDNS